ncbi:hypothetical protein PHLGIDRAFT_128242 [Phlebiopsis gigantea 11061_1 CR5-6]|uniref:CUE domain-containing protein n=1 Tax=Phlebiopsis gigantea (strain 11061_1 CR5-6) TaxID=745531 RepID=A0A0C3S9W2_PHLG1|nr:hypothetical protein PHLGIDRAFT_128242 [Phlebiopsis gigantea 11061_1 CR5-6]
MATATHILDEQDDLLTEPQGPTQPAPTQTAPEHEEHNEPANPAVALLKGMFPDFDDAVLQSVLESVNWNQDAAIDVLLGMSDPSYVSSHQNPVQAEHGADPSLELDEALARQLQLEDEQAHQRARGQTWQPRQPRRDSNPAEPGQGQPGAQQGENFQQEIKETITQLAESGKRTFSTIVSRVKAKINEYDQNRSGSQSQPQHPPPNWGSHSQQQQTPSNQSSPNPASYPSYYAEAPSQPVDRHAASQAYAQYYNHEADQLEDDEGWTAVSGRGRPTRTKAVTEQPKPVEVQGYDVDSPSPQPAAASIAPPIAIPAPGPSEAAAPIPSSPGSDVPRPPATHSGSPLNAAKFGLLPKRPVSLLTPQASAAKHPDDEDDDDLEYAENPFEESSRKAL